MNSEEPDNTNAKNKTASSTDKDENTRFLLGQKLSFINTVGTVCMAWWVSSVVFCGSILAAVWLYRKELVEPGIMLLLGLVLVIFFLSIIIFGCFIYFYLRKINKEVSEIVKSITSPDFFSTEVSTFKRSILLGTLSFFLILIAWAFLWWGLTSGPWQINKLSLSQTTDTLKQNEKELVNMNEWQMGWVAVSTIATIVQTLVVIISLGFIRRQVKLQTIESEQQTKLAQASYTQALFELTSPFNMLYIQDRELAELIYNGHKNYSSLGEVDKSRYRLSLDWRLMFQETIYYQNKNSLINPGIYGGWESDFKAFIKKRQLKLLWNTLKDYYTPEFSKYVTEIINTLEKESSKEIVLKDGDES